MSGSTSTHNLAPSALHRCLEFQEADGINGKIHLFERFSEIKQMARDWLKDLGKNGYEHSERLEEYLDDLTRNMVSKQRLDPAEAFVLLCAVYLHDIGYLLDGKLVVEGHPERSRDRILSNPEKYLMGDFPPFDKGPSRTAEAVALVALGHSKEAFKPLREIPHDFADSVLSKKTLNLRKLTALLRIADETDDPYIRIKDLSDASIRSKTPAGPDRFGDHQMALAKRRCERPE